MKKRTKRVYSILRGLRDNLDNVNLDMSHFLVYKGFTRYTIPGSFTEKTYATNLIQSSTNECKTACCLIGMIPMIDWEWAKKHNMDFDTMSTVISNVLHKKKSKDVAIAWTWIFSEVWNNDKEWAKTRLNLVIDQHKCYAVDFNVDYSGVTNIKDFIRMTYKDRTERLKNTYLLKGHLNEITKIDQSNEKSG